MKVENALQAGLVRSAMESKTEFVAEDLTQKSIGKVLMEKAWYVLCGARAQGCPGSRLKWGHHTFCAAVRQQHAALCMPEMRPVSTEMRMRGCQRARCPTRLCPLVRCD